MHSFFIVPLRPSAVHHPCAGIVRYCDRSVCMDQAALILAKGRVSVWGCRLPKFTLRVVCKRSQTPALSNAIQTPGMQDGLHLLQSAIWLSMTSGMCSGFCSFDFCIAATLDPALVPPLCKILGLYCFLNQHACKVSFLSFSLIITNVVPRGWASRASFSAHLARLPFLADTEQNMKTSHTA